MNEEDNTGNYTSYYDTYYGNENNDTSLTGGGNSSFFPDEDPNDVFQSSMKTTYNPDGSVKYEDPDGYVYTKNPDGTFTAGSGSTQTTFDPNTGKFTGTPTGSVVKFLNDKLGVNFDASQYKRLGAIGLGGIAGLTSLNNPAITKVGYQGGLPSLEAQRTMATAPVAGYRPGAGGTNYGAGVQYTNPTAHTAAPAAPVQTLQPKTTTDVNPYVGTMNRNFATAVNAAPTTTTANTTSAGTNVMTPAQLIKQQDDYQNQTVRAAQGGLMAFAHGGRYLQGNTDGMADKLRTSIDHKHPAALSHGEFVIPADVVSHLGNGNSDAGAQKLYQMMDRIRQARTGTKKQGKEINPDKFMPGGLAAAYAAGGSVSHFDAGGVTNLPTGTTGVDQTLATYTGDYVPNMLAQTQALTNTTMPQYTGPLTAGVSNLQNQAFTGASENAQAGYTPTAFSSGTFDTNAANQYMNPYLQSALNPQIAEARRQSDITAQQNNAQMTKAGAFGGGRQAILTAENQRNLGTNLAGIVGSGYNTAYNNAQQQFNAEQNRGLDTQKASEASRQYGADYGIKSLDQLSNMGAAQRGIASEGIAADKKAFEEARNAPYDQLKFQSQMLNGLPIQATNYTTAGLSPLQKVAQGMTTVDKALSTLGLNTPAT